MEKEDPWIAFKEWQSERDSRITRLECTNFNNNGLKVLQELTTVQVENENSEEYPYKTLQHEGNRSKNNPK